MHEGETAVASKARGKLVTHVGPVFAWVVVMLVGKIESGVRRIREEYHYAAEGIPSASVTYFRSHPACQSTLSGSQ